jgi:AcrR family transcriptional regulator
MTTDVEPTRQRILEAARVEFAAHGLAGARIDRIARAAAASKERLYAYYRAKDDLFTAVLELNLVEFTQAVDPGESLDAGSLPELAGALFDHTVEHPEHLRMIDWARLEGQNGAVPCTVLVDSFHDAQAARIAALQAAGHVDGGWDPGILSTLIFGILSAWVHNPSATLGDHASPDAAAVAARRAAVVRAVERLARP